MTHGKAVISMGQLVRTTLPPCQLIVCSVLLLLSMSLALSVASLWIWILSAISDDASVTIASRTPTQSCQLRLPLQDRFQEPYFKAVSIIERQFAFLYQWRRRQQ